MWLEFTIKNPFAKEDQRRLQFVTPFYPLDICLFWDSMIMEVRRLEKEPFYYNLVLKTLKLSKLGNVAPIKFHWKMRFKGC